MPSEKPRINQGYLHKALVSGTKRFPYRSGVRTLLGRPENPDTLLSYPLPLPPAGFRYLQSVSFDEMNDIPRAVPTKKDFSNSITDGLQSRSSIEGADQAAIKRTGPDRPPGPNSLKQTFPFVSPRPPVSGLEDKIAQTEKNRDTADEHSADKNAEHMQIDIPGFSEKVFRFPALEPGKKEAKSLSDQRPQSPGPQGTTKKTAAPETGEEKPVLPPFPIKMKAPNERPGLVSSAPQGETLSGKGTDALSFQATSKFKALKKHARTDGEIEAQASSSQNQKTFISSEGTQALQAAQMPRRQQAAEAQIEQLRQSLQTLKRKTTTQENKSEGTAHQETAEQSRPPAPLPQAVVIVKRAPIQSRTPAAFWERSYMSHLFRLRSLR